MSNFVGLLGRSEQCHLVERRRSNFNKRIYMYRRLGFNCVANLKIMLPDLEGKVRFQ